MFQMAVFLPQFQLISRTEHAVMKQEEEASSVDYQELLRKRALYEHYQLLYLCCTTNHIFCKT